MKWFLLLVSWLLCSCQAQLLTDCPSDVIIHPCRCNSQSVDCSDAQSAEQLIKSLTTGFQDTAEFNQLLIRGSSITYLPADVFRPIRSHVFTITQNVNLSYIDEDTFSGTEDFIRVLNVWGNDLQGVDIFVAMAKMKGLVAAILNSNSLSSVPERALMDMPELAHVDLSANRISSLGREAFANCPKLSSVILSNNELRRLPGRILAIDNGPVSIGDRVALVMPDNQIEEFEPDALDRIQKSIDIVLNRNQLQTLPREIFQPLVDGMLKEGSTNSISLHGNRFVCDCRMRWVVENQNYFKILNSILCSDTGKPLITYSLEDFRLCLS